MIVGSAAQVILEMREKYLKWVTSKLFDVLGKRSRDGNRTEWVNYRENEMGLEIKTKHTNSTGTD